MASANDDPHLDLTLTREVKLPRELIWMAWTEPKHLMPWFCPKPWQTVECDIDLRPGGIFRAMMRGPDQQSMNNIGCYLEVIKPQRLTFTSVLGPGFRPVNDPLLPFTAVLNFEVIPGGTRYTVRALHRSDADRQKHSEMGFDQGWSKALDQLIVYAPNLTG
jgi:uncharacterized protein YndB with AHSA1/START domain